MTKIAIICGGPSAERGISLNSARSIYDHLKADSVSFAVLYVDTQCRFYGIDSARLYSNTPSDFDFELATTSSVLSDAELGDILQTCDVAFPCIHGEFGEDGQLQQLLEQWEVDFVGSSSESCQTALNKFKINEKIANANLPALGILALDLNEDNTHLKNDFQKMLDKSPSGQVIVKPNSGGSSIGVEIIKTAEDVLSHCELLKTAYGTQKAVVEEYCDGKEFTVVVIQGPSGEPVALHPTEVDVEGKFDYRKKYLATEATKRHCPPRSFTDEQIDLIRQKAENIFTLFGMRDIARFDGFITNDSTVYFNDLNPISGMEQNSFFFQQICRAGWRHKDLLRYVVNLALSRRRKPLIKEPKEKFSGKQPVYVLFGGNSGEKEVSVMSGTNIWLKLAQSQDYAPAPFLITNDTVWCLPYAFCLDHTVSEIVDNCENAVQMQDRVARIAKDVQARLEISAPHRTWYVPEKLALDDFLHKAQNDKAFVFLGLHGGDGENGVLQQKLDSLDVNYNGPGPDSARLCMDKYKSGQKIIEANLDRVTAAPKLKIDTSVTPDVSNKTDALFEKGLTLWQEFQKLTGQDVNEFAAPDLLIKPKADGCSLGIVRLKSAKELKLYIETMGNSTPLPGGTFEAHDGIIEMNFDPSNGLIIEPFIETVQLRVENHQVLPEKVEGWVELTVGVVYEKAQLHSLVPSITVAEDAVLSLEEKFQGGTGVNLTPPPKHVISTEQCDLIRQQIENIADVLNIDGYARIDIFFNTVTNHIVFIEANTLPGLTPSTVIYHQALADTPSRTPTEFLEHLVQTKVYNKNYLTERNSLWTSQEIADAVGGEVIGKHFIVDGICIDSRVAQPNDLFFSLGLGYKFVDGARELGAVASISSEFVSEPCVRVANSQTALEKLGIAARDRNTATTRIAITGSVGKTCVTQAVAQVLSSAGKVHRPVSSYNNHVGVPVTLARMPKDTKFGVFELGMNNPGEISNLTQFVKPNVAIITKIGNAHTANFEDGLQGIANAKSEIFEGLEPGGIAIINRDTEWFDLLANKAREFGAKVLSFSTSQLADAQLLEYTETTSGASVKVQVGSDELHLNLVQLGQHWAENCLAILLLIKALNIPMAPAIRQLENVEALSGRGQIKTSVIDGKRVTLIDDSYNANPDSMAAAFTNLKLYPDASRRIAVLTDMLEQSHARQLHADLAPYVLEAEIDSVFVCGENMEALYENLPKSLRGYWSLEHDELLPYITSNIEDGDVILVKGSNGSGATKLLSALLHQNH